MTHKSTKRSSVHNCKHAEVKEGWGEISLDQVTNWGKVNHQNHGPMKICRKCHDNPSYGWDIAVWTKAVDPQADIAIPSVLSLAWLKILCILNPALTNQVLCLNLIRSANNYISHFSNSPTVLYEMVLECKLCCLASQIRKCSCIMFWKATTKTYLSFSLEDLEDCNYKSRRPWNLQQKTLSFTGSKDQMARGHIGWS